MNVLDVAAVLTLNSSQYDKGLADARDKAEGLGGAFGKLGKVVSTGMKVAAGAITATGGAIALVSKMSVSSYAEYEQMLGGVRKLYGNMGMTLEEYAKDQGKSIDAVRGEWKKLEKAQNEVLKNAQNAYKESGMSANQYMETATQFSASLIQSLGGDTVKAAAQTDVAMKTISDNFNTFGGNIEDITNAFKGFSKQNYMMLDNLKLGYGGTAKEMQRLIDDANKYAEANGKAADLSMDSFSDIITAIELIQEKQHIAGTTAREAATTIEGSTQMMKAAWENLLTGFADSDQALEPLIKAFLDSAKTVAKNVIPRFAEAFNGLAESLPVLLSVVPEMVEDLFDEIDPVNAMLSLGEKLAGVMPALVEGLSQKAEGLASVGIELIEGIAEGLPEGIPVLLEQMLPLISSLSEKLREGAGKLVDVGIKLIMSLAQGIVNSFPIIIEYMPTIITNIAGIINDNAPKLIVAGAQLIVMLAKGIIDSIPVIIENLPQIFKACLAVFTALNWAALGKVAVKGIANGIKALGKGVEVAAKRVANAGIKAFTHGFVNARSVGANAVKALAQAIAKGLGAVRTAAIRIAKGAINAIKGAFSNVGEIGMNLVRGIWGGISGGLGWIKSQISGWVGNVKSFLKSLFGIHSPSTWARDVIGMNIVRGLAEGLDDGMGIVDDAMEDLVSIPDIDIGTTSGTARDSVKQVSFVNNITVDGAENPEEFANRFVRQLQLQMRTA